MSRRGKKNNGSTDHPWYHNFYHQARHPMYPFKDDFWGFRRWAIGNGYDPKSGDKVVQTYTDGTYQLAVRKKDGTIAPGIIVVPLNIAHKPKASFGRAAFKAAFGNLLASSAYRPPSEPGGGLIAIRPDAIQQFLCDHLGFQKYEAELLLKRPPNFQPAEAAPDQPVHRLTARLQVLWERMLSSCYDSSSAAYPKIGQRGVRVCDEWHKFPKFEEWAISTWRRETLPASIVRAGRGDFSPEECKLI